MRRKKGSLNLSINAIVVLILAITMLGLGLGFMNKIFGGATDDLTKSSATVQKQIIQQLKESGNEIDVDLVSLELKAGKKETLNIALRNDENEETTFTIEEVVCYHIDTGDEIDCTDSDEALYVAMRDEYNIQPGDVGVFAFIVQTQPSTPAGTYSIDISVEKDGKTQLLTLTADVTA